MKKTYEACMMRAYKRHVTRLNPRASVPVGSIRGRDSPGNLWHWRAAAAGSASSKKLRMPHEGFQPQPPPQPHVDLAWDKARFPHLISSSSSFILRPAQLLPPPPPHPLLTPARKSLLAVARRGCRCRRRVIIVSACSVPSCQRPRLVSRLFSP